MGGVCSSNAAVQTMSHDTGFSVVGRWKTEQPEMDIYFLQNGRYSLQTKTEKTEGEFKHNGDSLKITPDDETTAVVLCLVKLEDGRLYLQFPRKGSTEPPETWGPDVLVFERSLHTEITPEYTHGGSEKVPSPLLSPETVDSPSMSLCAQTPMDAPLSESDLSSSDSESTENSSEAISSDEERHRKQRRNRKLEEKKKRTEKQQLVTPPLIVQQDKISVDETNDGTGGAISELQAGAPEVQVQPTISPPEEDSIKPAAISAALAPTNPASHEPELESANGGAVNIKADDDPVNINADDDPEGQVLEKKKKKKKKDKEPADDSNQDDVKKKKKKKKKETLDIEVEATISDGAATAQPLVEPPEELPHAAIEESGPADVKSRFVSALIQSYTKGDQSGLPNTSIFLGHGFTTEDVEKYWNEFKVDPQVRAIVISAERVPLSPNSTQRRASCIAAVKEIAESDIGDDNTRLQLIASSHGIESAAQLANWEQEFEKDPELMLLKEQT